MHKLKLLGKQYFQNNISFHISYHSLMDFQVLGFFKNYFTIFGKIPVYVTQILIALIQEQTPRISRNFII